jgi:hypothetical protein
MKWIFLAFYAGFGVFTNLLLLGSPIDWSSWLVWLLFLTWPAALFVIAFMLGFAVYLVLIFIVWALMCLSEISFVRTWSRRRNDKRIRKYYRRARART